MFRFGFVSYTLHSSPLYPFVYYSIGSFLSVIAWGKEDSCLIPGSSGKSRVSQHLRIVLLLEMSVYTVYTVYTYVQDSEYIIQCVDASTRVKWTY